MTQQNNNGTPKSSRAQTSLLNFFTTPKTAKAAERDSQEALLDQADVFMDQDMLAEVENVERLAAPSARKRKAAVGMDVDEEDYKPSTCTRNGKNRRCIDDDSDYEDQPQSPTPARVNGKASKASGLGQLRFNAAESSFMPDDKPLAASLSRNLHLQKNSSSGVGSQPLMQQLQSPPRTPTDAKRARVSAFAKKNEERYSWLEDVRDAQGLRPTDVGYDKRTLLIPQSAWRAFSPFERQYWEIKSRHWDTVVFFKKGKFYELYENDATIAHQEFDLKMTDRVNMRMAGVPESSFDSWVAQFVARGYRVARVDQMESRLAKEMRERGNSTKKGDNLVVRELTGVITAGTLVDPALLTQDLATYCLALVEQTHDDDSGNLMTSFGVAFVDTATAQFSMCTVPDDDGDRSYLETLLAQLNPREVLYVRGGAGPGSAARGRCVEDAVLSSPDARDGMAGISQATWRTLKNTCAPTTDWIALAPRSEFWDALTARREIDQYFSPWPAALQRAADTQPLALTAVGGLLSYLRTLKLDTDLASLGNFAFYAPVQHGSSLVLDGPSLANLDIFETESDGASGSLFSLLDHARTPFGRRLLRRWACHPLGHAEAINARMDAVEFCMGDVGNELAAALVGMPDLERILSRVHAGRCKVADFLALLSGLDAAANFIAQIRSTYGTNAPARIQALVALFPALDIQEFRAAFDIGVAESEGRLIPHAGSDAQYDEALAAINEVDAWLDQHLADARQRFGCASIVYKHIGKEQYQLEVPASVQMPDSYLQLSATKSVRRYWSPELRTKTKQRAEALETRAMVLDSYQTRLYSRFDRHYATAMKAVSVVAEIDCLLALATASSALGAPACRAKIVESGTIEFQQLRHPCVALGRGGSDFVANDIVLGRQSNKEAATMVLLTGPNMGGKSTLLRQVCLGVILAQIGCYVPAQAATITPVDRLFTRIGARDNLLAGRSTFMVEMAETAAIVRHATPRSLVVLDELGRGTSTHDGEAVAFGVLHGLCARLGCLGIFSTHYGLLADSLLHTDTLLRPMHMACAVDEAQHRVTFLYRLQHGVASKSHGMNVAAMAGVPAPIVARASAIAEQFEQRLRQRRRRAAESASTAADASQLLPLPLQSDFANLLRMAALPPSTDSTAGYEQPVGGAAAAKKANENQYWSCIIDHLRRTMALRHNGPAVDLVCEQHMT
ncbi:DNA mismatch repair protein msh6 [Coemansia brasiliensis]|uniref:DNA mismatch repair protein n=1 Tax=Coemansia brasiliensis TaxID=2650707 RepID=A0A9W8M0U5_9FUNG|nr:DNA mismatch repair protein msh6 [Coemansia brasiliensis]